MSQADAQTTRSHPGGGGSELVVVDASGSGAGGTDLDVLTRWISGLRLVRIAAIAMIAAQIAWRAVFLSQMFFVRDDFFRLDYAISSPFGWRYLSYVGTGHVMIVQRAMLWVLARISLYSWGLASAVSLALLAAVGLAAFAVLRTLFGERPAILIPLGIYLLSPLTIAALGWWTIALESLPLQLALLMALNSQIHYVRARKPRYLVAATAWVAFGMLSSEKGMIVPLLLFGFTSAFLVGGRSWLAGMRRALIDYKAAWLAYAVVLAGYAVVLLTALHTSTIQPSAPPSASAVLTFSWGLVRKALLPGAIGGPWRWWPVPGGWYALALPPAGLAWLSVAVAVVVVGVSVLRSRVSVRAWVIFGSWVVLADLMPVIISKLRWYPVLLALDTHYVDDAAPVLALCLGLAFLRIARQPAARSSTAETAAGSGPRPSEISQVLRPAMIGVLAVYACGSVWSAQAYQRVVSGRAAAAYIASATQAIGFAKPGTLVLDSAVPSIVADSNNTTRQLIGLIQPGKLTWVERPEGTIDGLQAFALDGQLRPVWVYGISSGRPRNSHGCWPQRHGRIVVGFLRSTPYFTTVLRIGYIWGYAPGYIDVWYRGAVHVIGVRPGLHSAYVPVSGPADSVTVTGLLGRHICIGDIEAGTAKPAGPP